jgi:hypothetical protein
MSNAKELLLAAIEAYAKLQSYQDAGDVRSSGSQSEAQMTASFTTRFAGSQRFQFRFESPHSASDRAALVSRNVIGADDHSAYHWSMNAGSTTARIEEVPSVDIAIARATGISFGAAHTTGQLLFKGMEEWTSRLVDW